MSDVKRLRVERADLQMKLELALIARPDNVAEHEGLIRLLSWSGRELRAAQQRKRRLAA